MPSIKGAFQEMFLASWAGVRENEVVEGSTNCWFLIVHEVWPRSKDCFGPGGNLADNHKAVNIVIEVSPADI